METDTEASLSAPTVELRMQPPSTEAVQRAVDILMQDWVAQNLAQNGTVDHACSSTPTFHEYDVRTSALFLCQKTIPKEISERISRNNQTRNTLAPISKLPVELMVKILELHIIGLGGGAWRDDHENGVDHFTWLHQVAQVSKRWDEIVRTSPSLWAFVHSAYTRELNTAALSRSRGAPLSISWQWSPELYPEENAERLHAFAEIDRPHIGRVRFLRMSAGYYADFLSLDFQAASTLETLILELGEHDDLNTPLTPIHIFTEEVYNLKDVHVIGLPVLWDPTVIRGLRSLTLGSIAPPYAPSPQVIHQILHMNPRITELTITSIYTEDLSTFQSLTSIHLPELARLRLEHLVPGLAQFFIASVIAPKCRHFTLRETLQQNESSIIQNHHLLTFAMQLKHSPLGLRKAIVTLDDSQVQFSVFQLTNDDPAFDLHLYGDQRLQALEWVTKALGDLQPPCVELIHRNSRDLDTNTFLAIITKWNNLESLFVETEGMATRLMEHLAAGFVEGGIRRWSCPDLRELVIDPSQVVYAEGLYRMVEEWYGSMPEVARTERPSRLRLLHVAMVLGGSEEAGLRKTLGSECDFRVCVEDNEGQVAWSSERTEGQA